jgi:BMFP domain-containing protein YqiC
MPLEKIDEIANTLLEKLPPELKTLQKSAGTFLHNALKEGLKKMDCVSREEFDAQQKILDRTRQQLKKLEEQVAALEK